jgi:hypothetical protein
VEVYGWAGLLHYFLDVLQYSCSTTRVLAFMLSQPLPLCDILGALFIYAC